MSDMTPPKIVIRCQDHPSYRGLLKPKRECRGCLAVRRMRGAGVSVLVYYDDYEFPSDETVIARWGSA